jgi:hypothetical protein
MCNNEPTSRQSLRKYAYIVAIKSPGKPSRYEMLAAFTVRGDADIKLLILIRKVLIRISARTQLL